MDEQEMRERLSKDFGVEAEAIESLKGRGAISGESFKVTAADGKRYKLRVSKRAGEIAHNARRFRHWFPACHGHHGRLVLFDWEDAPTWREARLAPPVAESLCYQLGKMVGEVHALEETVEGKSVERTFKGYLEDIRKAGRLPEYLIRGVERRYEAYEGRLEADIVLELNDIHPRNMVIRHHKDPKRAKVVFVDEDGLGHKVKGLGLAKPLLVEGFIGTDRQKRAFWKGYREHHSNDYFDHEYQEFIRFVQIVRTLATRSKIGASEKDFRKAQDRLVRFLDE